MIKTTTYSISRETYKSFTDIYTKDTFEDEFGVMESCKINVKNHDVTFLYDLNDNRYTVVIPRHRLAEKVRKIIGVA